jgi:hypothetical protein
MSHDSEYCIGRLLNQLALESEVEALFEGIKLEKEYEANMWCE